PDFNLSKNITLKELTQFPVILFEEDDPLFYRWCRLKYNSVPRKLNTKIVVNSFGHILKAVSEGMGIAIIPEHVYTRSFFKDKVSDLGADFKVHNNEFGFIFHEEAKDLLKISELYKYLKENP
ncbi:substrate-binding domain-containing protein, partial [Bacteriovoracaceae bacterium]|nr:substrate-binding domain-containing protein [Bacteriovoracaceae bacterium]